MQYTHNKIPIVNRHAFIKDIEHNVESFKCSILDSIPISNLYKDLCLLNRRKYCMFYLIIAWP